MCERAVVETVSPTVEGEVAVNWIAAGDSEQDAAAGAPVHASVAVPPRPAPPIFRYVVSLLPAVTLKEGAALGMI
jgi:hypothetical protein